MSNDRSIASMLADRDDLGDEPVSVGDQHDYSIDLDIQEVDDD